MTKWDNNFPKRIFFGKLHFGLSSGKKLLEGKNYGYVAISFNKNVTLELKKCRVRESKCFTSHFGVYAKWRTTGYINFVSMLPLVYWEIWRPMKQYNSYLYYTYQWIHTKQCKESRRTLDMINVFSFSWLYYFWATKHDPKYL